MPAVSPIYNNNPGFGLLTIDDSTTTIDKFEFTFLQLQEYHRFGAFEFETYNPAVLGNFDMNDGKSVRAHTESMYYDFQKFGYWNAKAYGLSDYAALGA